MDFAGKFDSGIDLSVRLGARGLRMRPVQTFLKRLRVWGLLTVFLQVSPVGCVLQTCAAGQDPADTPAPPPRVVFQNLIPSDQLAFLNDYAGKTAKEVMKDKRFRHLLKLATPRTTYHYGRDMSLSDTSETLLDGAPMPIDIRDGRYVMVASHSGPYLSGRAFFWFDMKEGIALGGVYFHPVNGEPTPTLAIFSRQLKEEDSLSMSQLPAAFAEDVGQWAAVAGVATISPRYFVPDNGRKYALLHDEDYCWHRENTPAPPLNVCEQMNADAADADLNAAYFMKETHNAANATAWMLEPDQVAWIGFRDRSCGVGPVGLPCRIRITRQRTRVLIGRHS
jgi:uncharacterized protein YecT (DUF1311 family)